MSWVKDYIDVGTVKVGTRVIVRFESHNPLNVDNGRIKSSCGCTDVKYDKSTKTLTVNYKPKSVPKHLKHKGVYEPILTVKVPHGKRSDILKFKARVVA